LKGHQPERHFKLLMPDYLTLAMCVVNAATEFERGLLIEHMQSGPA
jgi:hypothetical protein